MTESEIRALLPEYVDGEVDAEAARKIERALETSPALQAEAERWRALRDCVHRVVMAEEPPADLRERMAQVLQRGEAAGASGSAAQPRVYRLGYALMAVAALVLVSIGLQGRWFANSTGGGGNTARAAVVSAANFAEIYTHCGLTPHKYFQVDALHMSDTRARLAAATGLTVALPDMEALGYELRCACPCFQSPEGSDLHVLHAAYIKPDTKQVVSLFTVSPPVEMKKCKCCNCPLRGKLEVGGSAGVNVVKWSTTERSLAIVGTLPEADLQNMLASLPTFVHGGQVVGGTLPLLAWNF